MEQKMFPEKGRFSLYARKGRDGRGRKAVEEKGGLAGKE